MAESTLTGAPYDLSYTVSCAGGGTSTPDSIVEDQVPTVGTVEPVGYAVALTVDCSSTTSTTTATP